MEKLTYSIAIRSPRQKVWETVTDPESFAKWIGAICENGKMVGDWVEGGHVDFTDEGRGGTRALIETLVPHEKILCLHVAVITPDGEIVTSGEGVEEWVGTRENYFFEEANGGTTFTVEMHTHADNAPMFDATWPKALEAIKRLAES